MKCQAYFLRIKEKKKKSSKCHLLEFLPLSYNVMTICMKCQSLFSQKNKKFPVSPFCHLLNLPIEL